ncbi:MAG: SDR family NAD(P)-dependent oxidoreductase, partial [Sphingomicrobium sp.]
MSTSKIALVTGAGTGIGKAIAERLAADGARIAIADLQGAEEAAAGYPDGVGLTVDVADEEMVERMAAEVEARCGRLDVLVNNAGIGRKVSLEDEPLDDFRATMEINVTAIWHLC